MVSYCCRFIPRCVYLLQPLTDLLRDAKDDLAELPEESKADLNAVKDVLASATLLVHFDPAVSLSTVTGASDKPMSSVSTAVHLTLATTGLLFPPSATR